VGGVPFFARAREGEEEAAGRKKCRGLLKKRREPSEENAHNPLRNWRGEEERKKGEAYSVPTFKIAFCFWGEENSQGPCREGGEGRSISKCLLRGGKEEKTTTTA